MAEFLFRNGFKLTVQAVLKKVLERSTWICFIMILSIRVYLELSTLYQPIFEGYIGRQIPTAMVARGLANGDSFFYPSLQTGPFPSFFLVEPPIYGWLVSLLYSITGIELNACGRIVSLAGLIFACIGIWIITRRNFGLKQARFAVLFMVCWPVTIRFARAFQPDMLAIGIFVLGMSFYETSSKSGKKLAGVFSLILLSVALAIKITLFPLLLVLPGLNHQRLKKSKLYQIALMAVVLIPSFSWYLWAVWIGTGDRSHSIGQSGDGLTFWLKMLGPLALFSKESLNQILPNLLWKSFTPLAIILIPLSTSMMRHNPLIQRWLLAVICWLLLVGAKAHHSYYWLVPAPLIAILCASWLADSSCKPLQIKIRTLFALCLISLGFFQSRETWKTPSEWAPIATDLTVIKNRIESSGPGLLIAHEASIYAVNTNGLRWEWSDKAQQRAISTWASTFRTASPSPQKLLEFYLKQGGRWFLALESDPEWASCKSGLETQLKPSRVVYQSGGLILYDLLSHPSPEGEP